jgi:transposase
MFAVEIYAAVRRFVFVEGKSRREAARVFGLSRDTIAKMCRYSVPPGYVRSKEPEKPKLGPLVPVIDAILVSDKTAPPKQRHTAKRIFERLRIEHGFLGGYTVVKDYVRIARARSREVFVPLAHPPGHAQVDFGECVGVIGGVQMKLHVFCFDLPHSDACFIKAYPAETTEAFLDGHVSAFAFFGGVPISILYDNLKIAVAKILGNGKRQRTRAFTELVSHYLFQERFGRPGKGNDKGKVEALVKYSRANFLTPVPHAASFDALNATLEERCRARQAECAGRHEQTIGERLAADRGAFRRLPAEPFEACDKRSAKVSSTALVRYRMNDYSVPTAYGFRDVLVKGFVDEVVISCGADEIARHPRIYDRGQFVFDPRHYLALLEQKPGALDQAAPLQSWTLPEPLQHLRRLLEARMGNRGKREFIQVLRLMEVFPETIVTVASLDAIRLGAVSFDAVKQLVIAKIECRPVNLNLADYPYLPAANVKTTSAADYMVLISGRAA